MKNGFVKVFVLYVLPMIAIIGLIAYIVVRPPDVDKVGERLKPTPDPIVTPSGGTPPTAVVDETAGE